VKRGLGPSAAARSGLPGGGTYSICQKFFYPVPSPPGGRRGDRRKKLLAKEPLAKVAKVLGFLKK
jgi:hypothetical protein